MREPRCLVANAVQVEELRVWLRAVGRVTVLVPVLMDDCDRPAAPFPVGHHLASDRLPKAARRRADIVNLLQKLAFFEAFCVAGSVKEFADPVVRDIMKR